MDAFLNIKYKQVSNSDNYDDFLKHLGIGVVFRKAASATSPVSVLTKEGDVYTLIMEHPLKTMKTEFKLGEEFDDKRPDGTKVKTVITFEGNTFTQVQIDAEGKKVTNIREYSADKIVMNTTMDGWDGVCTRIFEKI